MPENQIAQRNQNLIKEQWEKFIAGKPVDPKLLSRRIYHSWKRSRAYGVDPYTSVRSDNTYIRLLEQAEGLFFGGGHLYNQFKQLETQYGVVISLYDKNGRFVSSQQGASAGGVSVAETVAGTNSVGLALVENQPSLVLGSEHYLKFFHNYFCAAAPIHDGTGNISGAINILCRDPLQAQNSLVLVTSLAEFIDSVHHLIFQNRDRANKDFEIEKILDHIPFGLVCLDDQNRIKYFNDKLVNILNVTRKQIIRDGLKKHHAIFENPVDYRKREIHIDSNLKIVVIEDRSDSAAPGASEGSRAVFSFENIIGENSRLVLAKETAKRVAKGSASVLIHGETGTGKELFAHAIHKASPRKGGPFVAINCGALPAELVESELFGYEPGSFTGALRSGKMGHLEAASGGTVFLDEIESMPIYVQTKLLRALSGGKILKVGGTAEIPIDVRIISATKKDLLKEADDHKFREDLFYRISTVTIEVPALRERTDDIPLLVSHFIKKHAGSLGLSGVELTDDFLGALCAYSWRGNVRELENVIERALLFLEPGKNKLDHGCLPERILEAYAHESLREVLRTDALQKTSKGSLLQIGEEIIIESVLRETRFRLGEACKRLGITRKTLYTKISNSEKLRDLKAELTENSSEG